MSEVDNSARFKDERVAVIGYGSQGRAHALNLKDSGVNVVVGLRKDGASWQRAIEDGMEVAEVAEAVKGADVVAILTPDMVQKDIYKNAVEPNLKPNGAMLFAHGFNIHFGLIEPRKDIDVIMVAPKGPGHLVRTEYERGRGVPDVIAVEQDASGKARDKAVAYAAGIGGTRALVIDTTFQEETETDLFGEQTVLCGGVSELVTKAFETLVEAGYQPEIAYYEVFHELKLIVDLFYEGGLAKMIQFVSETAQYGDYTRGPRVIDDRVKENMKGVLKDIQDGTFAREWTEEYNAGLPNYKKYKQADLEHPIEKVGAKLRARMTWLGEGNA